MWQHLVHVCVLGSVSLGSLSSIRNKTGTFNIKSPVKNRAAVLRRMLVRDHDLVPPDPGIQMQLLLGILARVVMKV